MTNTKPKTTKRTHFNALLALEAVQADSALVDFIKNEIALLDKKNASNAKRKNPLQEANEGLKSAIYEYLADGKGYTVSELIKSVGVLEGLSTSKVSALVRQMIDEDKVERYEEKRKAYFKRVDA